MKFIEQKLPGVFLIQPTPFEDERGIFRRHFCAAEFAEHGIAHDVKQANVSENRTRVHVARISLSAGASWRG
jgi:dTDP-4-dehydrorhamnose 3,5-epimerase